MSIANKITKYLMEILPIGAQRELSVVKHKILKGYAFQSYSQEGEDMILRDYFKKNNGFYVDVGANHPFLFSNTQLLYERGWNGINIDAYPGSMKVFKHVRRRDINLELGIGSKEKESDFLVFNDPLVSGFDSGITRSRHKQGRLRIKKKTKIQTIKLSKVLDKHVKNRKIDLLNVDVEGHELDVLKSNNWEKYVPRLVIVEVYANSVEEAMGSKIYKFMAERGYKLYAKTKLNLIFEHS